MKTFRIHLHHLGMLAIVAGLASSSCSKKPDTSEATVQSASARTFANPNQAADALIDAAAKYDVGALLAILGPEGHDLVASSDTVQDKKRATDFVAKAREKKDVVIDPKDASRASLVVGASAWPLPIPIVKSDDGKWSFDSAAGREEVLARRIGANELDVISICHGYVDAQKRYATELHDDSRVHQYARRVLSTPGKHDGLAWQNPDGTWAGPVGPNVAHAIEQGFAAGEPFHGYYFKILQGQGPNAPLGQMDYVVGDAMIGGFALVAWPAEYRVTGVQTFMVDYDGIVRQKDLGPQTKDVASKIDRYDPDATWARTDDDW